MLRQLAFSVSTDSAIGKDGKIAYRFKSDMSSFRWYTACTVLIAGYRTALELADENVNLSGTRREIVVVGRPCAALAKKFAAQNISAQFAESLPDAISMATLIARGTHDLQGFTIIGGASILSELAVGSVWDMALINSAMITEFDHTLGDSDAVTFDDDLLRRIKVNMVQERQRAFCEFGKVLGLDECVEYRITEYSRAGSGFWFDGTHLHIDSTAGMYRLNPFDVQVVREERQRNMLTLILNNGKELEIRLADSADISGLSRLLKRY